MKTRALLLALPILALTASCTRENRASVQIQSVCFPKNDCTMGATCDRIATGLGALDVAFPAHTFVLELQVANLLPDNGNVGTGKTNTNGAHIDGVTVEYSGVALPKLSYSGINQYVPANGTTTVLTHVVSPLNPAAGGQTTGGLLDAAVPALGDVKQLNAKIKFRGYLDDGSRFETGEFPTSLELCNGCIGGGQCPADKFECHVPGMEPVACATDA